MIKKYFEKLINEVYETGHHLVSVYILTLYINQNHFEDLCHITRGKYNHLEKTWKKSSREP